MTPLRGGPLATLVLALALAGGGCALTGTAGSGRVVSETVTTGPFTAVDVGSSFVARLHAGPEHDVELHVDDNLRDLVEIGVQGERLVVRLRPGSSVRSATLEVDVTLPELHELEASGASRVSAGDTFDAGRLRLDASGASELVAALDADRVELEASGASTVRLSGVAVEVAATASGASTLDLDGLDVGTLRVDLSGASEATATVHDVVDARASGASHLRFAGDATVERSETSGASSIDRR